MNKLLGVGFGIATFAVLAAVYSLLAFPVKWCWNGAVPDVFGLPQITWGEAWCLLFLSSLFLKSNFSSTAK